MNPPPSPHVRELLPGGLLAVCLGRLMHELLEKGFHPQHSVLVGIQPRGPLLARRLARLLEAHLGQTVRVGDLDITFHRDDLRHRNSPPVPAATHMPHSLEGQHVVLVDDVLYTGRTVRSALDALLAFGRPRRTELLVLVDRRQCRELPILPNYVGLAIHTLPSERVVVEWQEAHGRDSVRIEALSPTNA